VQADGDCALTMERLLLPLARHGCLPDIILAITLYLYHPDGT
jgi:hypothetical protein